jgi:hypothetical protein
VSTLFEQRSRLIEGCTRYKSREYGDIVVSYSAGPIVVSYTVFNLAEDKLKEILALESKYSDLRPRKRRLIESKQLELPRTEIIVNLSEVERFPDSHEKPKRAKELLKEIEQILAVYEFSWI